MNAQEFADSIALEIAVEQVGENADLPIEWQEGCVHFLCGLLRPGAREATVRFSVPQGLQIGWDEYGLLGALSYQSRFYVEHPTPVSWCELTGLDLETVTPVWASFERDQQTLVAFFGEHYQGFLDLE